MKQGHMKLVRAIGPATLLLLSTATLPAGAQHGHRQQGPGGPPPGQRNEQQRQPGPPPAPAQRQDQQRQPGPRQPQWQEQRRMGGPPMGQQPQPSPQPSPQSSPQPYRQEPRRVMGPHAQPQFQRQQPPPPPQVQQRGMPPGREQPGFRGGPAAGQPVRGYPPPQRNSNQARSWQRQNGWRQQGAWQGHGRWQEHRASHWAVEHRTWTQRGGYGGYTIPPDRYHRHFGSEHTFRFRARPTIYMGYPRFQYSGFNFIFVDPWPEYWSDSWYADDDVYVEYDDGYYLYNRSYPGVAIAISVVL